MEDILMEIVKDRVDEKISTAVSTAEVAKEQETTVIHIRDIMDSLGITAEKAMDILKILPAQRATYAGLVKKKM